MLSLKMQTIQGKHKSPHSRNPYTIPAEPEHYGTVGRETLSPSSQTILWCDSKPLSQKGEISPSTSIGPVTFPFNIPNPHVRHLYVCNVG